MDGWVEILALLTNNFMFFRKKTEFEKNIKKVTDAKNYEMIWMQPKSESNNKYNIKYYLA